MGPDPELLKQWFAPRPYTTPVAELDVRPGGANLIVMRDPDGNDLPNRCLAIPCSRSMSPCRCGAGFSCATHGCAHSFLSGNEPYENTKYGDADNKPGTRVHRVSGMA
jgi:hypothetical protein